MSIQRIKSKKEFSATDAAELLSAIALGLASGEIRLTEDGRVFRLWPGNDVRVQIKASQNQVDGSVSIEVDWKNNLRITSGVGHW